MSSVLDSYLRLAEFRTVMTAEQITEQLDHFYSNAGQDARTSLTHLARHIGSLLGDAGELLNDFIYDGYDQLSHSENGLTEEQRDVAVTAMETVARNIGSFATLLRHRAEMVSRRPGWDPLESPISH